MMKNNPFFLFELLPNLKKCHSFVLLPPKICSFINTIYDKSGNQIPSLLIPKAEIHSNSNIIINWDTSIKDSPEFLNNLTESQKLFSSLEDQSYYIDTPFSLNEVSVSYSIPFLQLTFSYFPEETGQQSKPQTQITNLSSSRQSIVCIDCRQTLISLGSLDSISPLPSSSWNSLSSDWICHKYDDFHRFLRDSPQATSSILLYSSFYFQFSSQSLVSSSYFIDETQGVYCSRCFLELGEQMDSSSQILLWKKRLSLENNEERENSNQYNISHLLPHVHKKNYFINLSLNGLQNQNCPIQHKKEQILMDKTMSSELVIGIEHHLSSMVEVIRQSSSVSRFFICSRSSPFIHAAVLVLNNSTHLISNMFPEYLNENSTTNVLKSNKNEHQNYKQQQQQQQQQQQPCLFTDLNDDDDDNNNNNNYKIELSKFEVVRVLKILYIHPFSSDLTLSIFSEIIEEWNKTYTVEYLIFEDEEIPFIISYLFDERNKLLPPPYRFPINQMNISFLSINENQQIN